MKSMLAELPAPFINDAGKIQNLVEIPTELHGFHGVAIIESKAGSRRSSHRHAVDSHYLFVMSGAMRYRERRVGSETVVEFTVHPGEMVFTGPNVDHWAEFPVDTVMISVSKLSRTHEEHEADVTRVPWLEEQ